MGICGGEVGQREVVHIIYKFIYRFQAIFLKQYFSTLYLQGVKLPVEAATVIIATVNHETTTRKQMDANKMVTIQMV